MEKNEEDFRNYQDLAWATNHTDDHNYMAVMELKKKITEEKGQDIYSSFLFYIGLLNYQIN